MYGGHRVITWCKKCNYDATHPKPTVKYRPEFKGYWDEHLDWTCNRCGYEWKTETLDKKDGKDL